MQGHYHHHHHHPCVLAYKVNVQQQHQGCLSQELQERKQHAFFFLNSELYIPILFLFRLFTSLREERSKVHIQVLSSVFCVIAGDPSI